jgi:spoIIIJ-associated protein
MHVEITDKSLELALVQASGRLGVSHSNIDYKVISEKKKLWGLLGTTIKIEAWAKNKERHPRRPEHKRAETKTEKLPAIEPKVLSKLQNFCEEICSMMTGEPVKIQIRKTSRHYAFECENEYLSEKIVKMPKLSDSIERILLLVFKDEIEDKHVRIFFDASGARQNKEKELISLARNLARKVARTKKPVTLNYRHAQDRKIVHMALDSDKKVYTKSVGSGADRKLLIIPIKGNESRQSHHD